MPHGSPIPGVKTPFYHGMHTDPKDLPRPAEGLQIGLCTFFHHLEHREIHASIQKTGEVSGEDFPLNQLSSHAFKNCYKLSGRLRSVELSGVRSWKQVVIVHANLSRTHAEEVDSKSKQLQRKHASVHCAATRHGRAASWDERTLRPRTRLHKADRPCQRAHRRSHSLRQRRLVRTCREPAHLDASRLQRWRLHWVREVDGRVGDATQAHSWPRLVHYQAGWVEHAEWKYKQGWLPWLHCAGAPGKLVGFDVDTSFFTGNNAPKVSIQAAFVAEGEKRSNINTVFQIKI